MRAEVIAVEAHRVADAVIERVADRRAPARVRRVDPHLEIAVLNVAVEVDVRHAGLDEREVALRVDLEHAIHALQVHGHAAAHVRRRPAVREVLAGRDRVERDLVLVGGADDRLHLLGRVRPDGRRRDQLVRLILDVGEVIAVRMDVFVAREDPFLADGRFEFFDRSREILRADSGWQYRHAPSPLLTSFGFRSDGRADRRAGRDDPREERLAAGGVARSRSESCRRAASRPSSRPSNARIARPSASGHACRPVCVPSAAAATSSAGPASVCATAPARATTCSPR